MEEADDSLEQIGSIPVETILDDLAVADVNPLFALRLAVVRAADTAPPLLAVLADAADGRQLTDREENLIFYGLHVLAASRNPAAFKPLLQLLHLPEDDLDYLLGDAVTETLARLAIGVFDGDAAALFAAIADAAVAADVRSALMSALAFLAWEGRVDAGEAKRFVERFGDERLAAGPDDEMLWYAWQEAIALLGWRDLAPKVEAAFADGRLHPELLSFADFLEDLARAEADPGNPERFEDARLGYIEDIGNALAWVMPKTLSDRYKTEPYLRDTLPMVPIKNPMRHVGRNDPCPCGSGKKAKKCCLATA